MRIHIDNPTPTSIGNVDVYETFRVTQLDAGHYNSPTTSNESASPDSIAYSHDMLRAIENELAIVVPSMNEHHSIMEGVIQGIPNDCLVIIVSNSNAENYQEECNMLKRFCNDTKRAAVIVHQQDGYVAQVFYESGMPELLSPRRAHDGQDRPRIAAGKGQAMMIGSMIAKIKGKKYIGFVDADNVVPGSVHEYCKIYAAGIHYALNQAQQSASQSNNATETEPLAMVRITWNSKPKARGNEIVFEKTGRCSRVVNEWMNRYFSTVVGDNSNPEMIQTANAGEHAMSVDLALELQFATSYAVEPFQLIDILERYGVSDGREPVPDARKVKILQIKSRNPHFHDSSKGDSHIDAMVVKGLSTIYHSRIVPKTLKEQLRHHMMEELAAVDSPMKTQTSNAPLVGPTGVPAKPRVYPPMKQLDWDMGLFKHCVDKMIQY